MTYSIETITTLVGAHRIGSTEAHIDWLLTDSRSLVFPESSLFFAIRTQKNDGHRYIAELYRRGVRSFVVSQVPENPESDANYLKVPSPLKALQRLAERHREEFDISVVGITGSNGKTIVKEWLYQLLAPDFNIPRSPRSWNSQIGVPLSVWRLKEQTQIGIFEAGISEPGEMDALEGIIQPTVGVMTHLGSAHDENFANRQEKCLEKLRLFRHAKVLVFNADDEMISDCVAQSGFKGQLIGWHGADFDVPFMDSASREDVIHCICVCRYFGLDEEVIRERVKSLEPVAMRLEVKEGRNGCTLITDTCNSDLGSLEIALDFMRRRPDAAGRRRTLILSDIKQTGLTLTDLYGQVRALVEHYGVDELIGIGPEVSAGLANQPQPFDRCLPGFIALCLTQQSYHSHQGCPCRPLRPHHGCPCAEGARNDSRGKPLGGRRQPELLPFLHAAGDEDGLYGESFGLWCRSCRNRKDAAGSSSGLSGSGGGR